MEILPMLQDWLVNGLIVSVILTAFFLMVSVHSQVLIKLIILFVSALYTWLVMDLEFGKEYLSYFIGTLAFSIAFYELAGRYIVKAFFNGYKKKKPNQEDI